MNNKQIPKEKRLEHDLLGKALVPADKLWGVHTLRAIENFPVTGWKIHPELIHAYGAVKLACAQTNLDIGVWEEDPFKGDVIFLACDEMRKGLLDNEIVVDPLQGGAGTSLNMNVNEVIANQALIMFKRRPGEYHIISPLDDINRHQSTNDTYPTALKLAAIRLLAILEEKTLHLQEAFQEAEKRFAHVVKVGRTQMQDAALITLGREMSAYAEAFNRDRWRIYKCQERLRVVNLGGTAIGTGIGAPRQFIFRVVDNLREISGIGFARAENLVEATQNADVFVEVSGIFKACAVNLLKVSSDLRFLSSGPEAGIQEILLPPRQAGSSIMPGKVNPVIPECVSQAAMLVMGYDGVIAHACASGNLELNPFLPLVAHCLLNGIEMLANACDILRSRAVEGMQADEAKCARHIDASTATVTALLPKLGYERCVEIARCAREKGVTIREAAVGGGCLTPEEFDALIQPESVCRLGMP